MCHQNLGGNDKLCLLSSITMTLKWLCRQQFTAFIDQLRREKNTPVNNTALKYIINAKHNLTGEKNLTKNL